MKGVIFIKKYRNEWKYSLTNQDLSLLKSRICEVLDLDPHSPTDGKYLVHSLYFDDYKDTSLYEVEAGLSSRYKWRIRYYGNDLNYIVLEKKEKIASRCHKKSCKLSISDYESIVGGNITDIVYKTKENLIRELAADMLINHYKPKVIVDYERIAYIEEVTNVRITFDMKIAASYDIEHFLEGDYPKYYIMPSNQNVLEVKFDEILPSYIKKIVESYGFTQTSFSKYYYARKIIDSYIR